MDEHLCAWILEFIIRKPETESLTEPLLRTLPVPDGNSHLQILVLLRSIGRQVEDNSISDKTLEELEVIEQIYRDQGVAITGSMKKAYCSVALDCTVQACDKLWRTKSACVEKSMVRQLVGEIFGLRREDDAPVVWDPVKTRNCALTALTEYLAEAYGIAPSFLETVANDESLVRDSKIAEDGSRQEEQSPICDTQIPVNSTDLRSHANEPISSTEDQVGEDPIITNGDSENVNEAACVMDTAKEHELTESPKAQENCIYELKRRKRPSHVVETKETDIEPCCSPNYSLSSEVRKARKALKVSCQELKAVVTDPLPEALRVSETVASGLEMKDADNKHISELDKGVAAQPPATNNEALQCDDQDQVNQHPPNSEHIAECVNANVENRQILEGDPGKKPCSKLRILPRPSLMQRNVTAHTYEWEDTISSCSEGPPRSRIQLQSPKGNRISPLKKENLDYLGRRRRKKWSVEEEDALREAVYKYGIGKWSLILKSNPEVFEDRKAGDLKDKWRNMTE